MIGPIDANVPLPVAPPKRGRPSLYRLAELGIGDSILILGNIASARASMSQHSRRYGRSYMSRTEGDGIRVWRTA